MSALLVEMLGCVMFQSKFLIKYKMWWCPKKYADIKRQANNGISIVQNFLLKQRNLANLNY